MLKVDTETQHPKTRLPAHIRLLGIISRTLFIVLLIAITARVASPEVETIWSAYETPNELVRMALGLAVCLWLFINIFRLPKDPGGYWTWLYLGAAIVPLGILCAIVIW